MATPGTPEQRPWYTTRQFIIGALVVLGLAGAVEGYLAIFVRDNDFLVHRCFGEAFLAGNPMSACQLHYLLSRGLINGLTAWLPYRLHRGLHFAAAVGVLGLSLLWWHRLAGRRQAASGRLGFAAGIFTLALVAGYLIRDLDDCGLQLFLLFFLTAGAYCLSKGQSLGCGFCLGLAAAYKVTPVLFFPFLLWKRQWRAAGWMAVFALAWNVAPVFYLGWESTQDCHRNWLEFSRRCMTIADPSMNPLEPPRHLNQGLAHAIARFVQTYPPGHPLSLEHPWFVQFGALEPHRAKQAVQVVLLAFAGLLAWRFRRPYGTNPDRGDLAHEWAAVTLLCALLSPLCWLQHLVLVIPCVFLWFRAWLAGQALPRWHLVAIAVFAAIELLVHRELVSRDCYELLVAYKLHTLAALLALALVLTRSAEVIPAPADDRPASAPPLLMRKSELPVN